jgi:hypothetical protein
LHILLLHYNDNEIISFVGLYWFILDTSSKHYCKDVKDEGHSYNEPEAQEGYYIPSLSLMYPSHHVVGTNILLISASSTCNPVTLFTKILTIKNCRKCKTKIKKSFTKIPTIILSVKIVLTLRVKLPCRKCKILIVREIFVLSFIVSEKMKLEAPRSLYSSPGYNNNISQ